MNDYSYFESLKKRNLIFTEHNMNPRAPYMAIDRHRGDRLIETPEGPSYWSHLSGRYRDYDEQMAFIRDGCVDKRLPPKRCLDE